MWFKKKTELERQILSYGKDTDILLEFARSTGKQRLEECTLHDIERFYTDVVALYNGQWQKITTMRSIRHYFKFYRSANVLNHKLIWDNPWKSVGKNVTIKPMEEVKKPIRGRPANIEMIKKVKFLIDQGGLTIRGVSRAEGIDPKNVHQMYHYPKGYKNADLLVEKLSTQ